MNNERLKLLFVGVDTHKLTHTATVANCWGEKLDEVTFENKPSAFEEILKMVKKHKKKGMKEVYGLEDVDTLGRALALFLISNKKTVKKVDAILTYSERRNQPIIHKTDAYDSLCLARVLINRLNELPDAKIDDIYWTLSQLVNRRSTLVDSNIVLKNQLHAQLTHHFVSYQKFFFLFDCNTALEFWDKYPSPDHIKGVTVEELGKFLREKSHNTLSDKKAATILNLIENDRFEKADYQPSRDFMVKSLVKNIKQNNKEITETETEIKKIMDELGYKLDTFPGLDLASASAIVAEIGDIKRFANAGKVAKFAGVAPVQYSSGSKDRTFKSRQGNRKLCGLIYFLAVRQINTGRNGNKPVNPIFYEYYQKKLKEGKTKAQGLLCIMRRLVNIIYGMMKNKTEYKHPVSNLENE